MCIRDRINSLGVYALNGFSVSVEADISGGLPQFCLLYTSLMPVPALSFATRHLHCDAGIMVTASHKPAKYNGYKAYGPDGCQMTSEAADAVYEMCIRDST